MVALIVGAGFYHASLVGRKAWTGMGCSSAVTTALNLAVMRVQRRQFLPRLTGSPMMGLMITARLVLLLALLALPFTAGAQPAAKVPRIGFLSPASAGSLGLVIFRQSLRELGYIVIQDRGRIVDLAAKHRLPAAYGFKEDAEAGGLMSYGPRQAEVFQLAATYVDKILKGAKPGDLPVEQPTNFELVVNLKTSKALGLTIPPSFLLRADQVIE